MRLLLLLPVIFLFLIAYLFPEQLLIAYSRYKLHHFCKKELHAEVSMGSVLYEKGRVSFKNLLINRSGYYTLQIDEAILIHAFNLKKRELLLNFEINHLLVAHQNREEKLFLPPFSCKIPFIKLHLDLQIDRGEISLYDYHLIGKVAVKSTFHERGIDFSYVGQDVILESPHIKCAFERPIEGIHSIDFLSWEHRGLLPIQEAFYYQKNRELPFENCQGLLYFENNKIDIKNLQAYSEGIAFSGKLHLELRSVIDVDLKIETERIEGSFASATKFLSHIAPSFFWQLPFSGELTSGLGGCSLQFHFAPQSKLLEARVGGFFKGSYDDGMMQLEEIESSFSYQKSKNRCLFTESSALYKSFLHKEPYSLKVAVGELFSFPQTRIHLLVDAEDPEGAVERVTIKSQEDQRIAISSHDFQARLLIKEGIFFEIDAQKGKIGTAGKVKREGSFFCIDEASITHADYGKIEFSGHCDRLTSFLKMHSIKIDAKREDWRATLSCESALFDLKKKSLYLDRVLLDRACSFPISLKKGSRFKSFEISAFTLDAFEVNLEDLTTSLGQGKLTFTNFSRRTFLNHLFFFPVEITARLGFDKANFIPVRGQVDFEVKEGRVVFHEFNNMYSEGKRSLFYLAAGEPSYIDFGGNVNIRIKMKQYTLLTKLADLFTFSIKGTLKEPRYTTCL